MSLKLPNFFLTRGYLNNIQAYRLAAIDLGIARVALTSDVNAFFINGLISFASAIHSLNKDNYSWSFIQSYYSLFYFARAFNGINDYAIVYNNLKPYSIKIQPAEGFKKLSGNSHDVVLNQFKQHFHTDTLLSSNIEGKSPVDWFNKSRNLINYTLNPLTDPEPPINLYKHNKDLRKLINTYLNDDYHVYTFDPKHCYIAYPLQVFNRIYKYYLDNDLKNEYFNDETLDYFKVNFADEKGALTSIISKIVDLSD